MWQDTLRLRQPHLDGMRGLRRITLNKNPKLNDNGAAVIGNALTEDLWIKGNYLKRFDISVNVDNVYVNWKFIIRSKFRRYLHHRRGHCYGIFKLTKYCRY